MEDTKKHRRGSNPEQALHCCLILSFKTCGTRKEIEDRIMPMLILPRLIFDNALHNKLLRFLLRMSMQTGQLASRMRSFNRLVLLYGPPGTGKSTLCRAIAQKLAIRLRRQYEAMKLLEIDAATLFSKFFGESSKLVSRIFDKIERMLEQEPRVFLCVLVDEIESLATSRQQSVGANEPRDSMRVSDTVHCLLSRKSTRLIDKQGGKCATGGT
ncbi:MAG: hypothetical protein Q9179_000443 [Wetmoreana sp. 5 TL-2023]